LPSLVRISAISSCASKPSKMSSSASGICRVKASRSVSRSRLELQLHLLEQAARAFGAGAVLLAPELGDLQLAMGDHRLGRALAGTSVGQLRFGFVGALERRDQQRLERFNSVREGRNGRVHEGK
jgi:hypothetical protein